MMGSKTFVASNTIGTFRVFNTNFGTDAMDLAQYTNKSPPKAYSIYLNLSDIIFTPRKLTISTKLSPTIQSYYLSNGIKG